MDGADDEKLLAIDLEVDLHIRVLEAHTVAHAVLVQTAAHVALHFEGGELVLAVALGTHAEGLALELITPDGFHLLEDVVQVGKLAGLHLEEGLNAGNAGQGFDGLLAELVITGAHDQLVPIHPHPGIVVEAALKKEAEQKNIKVSGEEVQKVVTQIESQFPTKEAFMQYMEQTGVNEKKLKEDISGRLAQQKVLEGLTGSVVVSDDEVAKFYESTKDLFFRRPAGYNVNFASFATREQAQKARGQIVAGGDWDKILEAMSGDVRNSTPYAKPTFIAEKELTGEMKVLLQLPIGKVSPLVSVSSEDVVLVLKREKSPERVLSLAEVKGEIQKMLASQKEREIQQKFLQELKAKTPVKILDPSIFPAPKAPESEDKSE